MRRLLLMFVCAWPCWAGCSGSHDGQATALALRASFRANLGHVDEALGLYSEAIRLSPDCHALYVERANQYLAKRSHDQARADLQEALRLAPGYGPAHLSLARLYEAKKDPDRALAAYADAARLCKDKNFRAGAHERRGWLLAEVKGEHARAIAEFSAALELKPGDTAALRGRSQAYEALGEFAKADADTEAVFRSCRTADRTRPRFPHELREGDLIEVASEGAGITCGTKIRLRAEKGTRFEVLFVTGSEVYFRTTVRGQRRLCRMGCRNVKLVAYGE